MLTEPIITVHGNLTGDPELRFTPNGKAVIRFTVAQNPRVKNRNGEWTDGTASFFPVQAWGKMAENVAESLSRGDRVTVNGRIRTDEYPHKETGETVRRQYIEADDIAVSLSIRAVTIKRTTRTTSHDAWSDASPNRPENGDGNGDGGDDGNSAENGSQSNGDGTTDTNAGTGAGTTDNADGDGENGSTRTRRTRSKNA